MYWLLNLRLERYYDNIICKKNKTKPRKKLIFHKFGEIILGLCIKFFQNNSWKTEVLVCARICISACYLELLDDKSVRSVSYACAVDYNVHGLNVIKLFLYGKEETYVSWFCTQTFHIHIEISTDTIQITWLKL